MFILASFFEIRADEMNDLGVHGAVFSIEEESLLEVMKKRLGSLQESGALQAMQDKMVSYAQKNALEPKRLEHITKTTTPRVYRYDPTLEIQSDIVISKDVQGKEVVLAKKGDRINPLDKVAFTRGLLFIDGEDPDQLKLIDSFSKDFDIVLVAGKPMALKERFGVMIFFDQGGILTKRFGIQQVPSKVEAAPDGARYLQITAFKP